MLRTLLTRRWIVLTLVLAALIPTFYRLGLWQYHRYEQANALNRMIDRNQSAAPAPVTSLSKPGGTVPFSLTYRTVSATGHYDAAHQFVVRQRTNASSAVGFQVVTPLITSTGEAVLVNRGWVAPASQSGTAYPEVPDVPGGKVTVTGRLRPDETYASTGIHKRASLPPHQSVIINSAEHAREIPDPVVAGYMELTATSPKPAASAEAELVPGPQQDTNSMAVVGQGVHLPYAIQWWIFAAAVPLGWWILLRRDTEIDAEARAAAAPGDAPAGPDPEAEPEPAPAAAAPAPPAGGTVSPAADLYALLGNGRRRYRGD
ncbi:SURF1 family protein [Streptomyces tremellae]|uniref:SURF1-like protein n=1 Tax=Streptomyces tremellae TaxID=1124239 RepID=A0ABP7EW84_9ACTN